MLPKDLIYQLALTMVPQIGPVQARILLQHCEPEEIFHAKRAFLEKIEGIGPARATAISQFNDFARIEDEIHFIEKYSVQPLFITHPAYPRRLLNCTDAPVMLFYKGSADLNAERMLAVIGSRSHTEYARQVTEKLIAELAPAGVCIVSGLAYGVDALAHKAALKHQLPTVGVLGHGLNQVYPAEHSGLARDMLQQGGGLLTEFQSQTIPDKHNFPIRNRVVAGMCDAVLVVETGIKGGSMITAELAGNYNRDVFALPGKITDPKSAGCNFLIRQNKAILLTDARQLLETMGWPTGEEAAARKKKADRQKKLFIELSPNEKIITGLLQEKEPLHIDEINARSGLSTSAIAAAILNLELQNVLVSLPGKQYQLA